MRKIIMKMVRQTAAGDECVEGHIIKRQHILFMVFLLLFHACILPELPF